VSLLPSHFSPLNTISFAVTPNLLHSIKKSRRNKGGKEIKEGRRKNERKGKTNSSERFAVFLMFD
jgi:hypothetical protein